MLVSYTHVYRILDNIELLYDILRVVPPMSTHTNKYVYDSRSATSLDRLQDILSDPDWDRVSVDTIISICGTRRITLYGKLKGYTRIHVKGGRVYWLLSTWSNE